MNKINEFFKAHPEQVAEFESYVNRHAAAEFSHPVVDEWSASVYRQLTALGASAEKFAQWKRENLPSVASGRVLEQYPEDADRTTVEYADQYYTKTDNSQVRMILRVLGHDPKTWEQHAVTLVNLAGVIRTWGKSSALPPRRLTIEEMSNSRPAPLVTEFAAGPAYLMSRIKANELPAIITAKPGDSATIEIHKVQYEWKHEDFNPAQASQLARSFSHLTQGGLKVVPFTCLNLARATAMFLNSCTLEPQTQGGKLHLAARIGASLTEAHCHVRKTGFVAVLAALKPLVVEFSDRVLAVNAIQKYIYDNRAKTTKFLFELVDPTIVPAYAASQKAMADINTTVLPEMNRVQLMKLVIDAEASKTVRNAGGNSELFRGNGSPYGTGVAFMAEAARYTGLAAALKTAGVKNVVCHSDSNAQYLHSAMDRAGFAEANWDPKKHCYDAFTGHDIHGKCLVLDTYKAVFGAAAHPGATPFVENVVAAFSGKARPATLVLPFKAQSHVGASDLALVNMIKVLPKNLAVRFVMTGKLHVPMAWAIMTLESSPPAKGHFDIFMAAMSRMIKIAYIFETHTKKVTDYGLQLPYQAGQALVRNAMADILADKEYSLGSDQYIIENTGPIVLELSGRGTRKEDSRIKEFDQKGFSVTGATAMAPFDPEKSLTGFVGEKEEASTTSSSDRKEGEVSISPPSVLPSPPVFSSGFLYTPGFSTPPDDVEEEKREDVSSLSHDEEALTKKGY